MLGATQNQNESFNAVVWNRCSKTDFTSALTVQTAVNLAVLSFNRGAKSFVSLAERMGVSPGVHCATHFHKCDVFRIKRSEIKQSAREKKRRRDESLRKAAAEERMHQAEGDTYRPGLLA